MPSAPILCEHFNWCLKLVVFCMAIAGSMHSGVQFIFAFLELQVLSFPICLSGETRGVGAQIWH